jgi:hypothetical protein
MNHWHDRPRRYASLRFRSQKHPRTDGPTDVLGKRATYFIVTALLE